MNGATIKHLVRRGAAPIILAMPGGQFTLRDIGMSRERGLALLLRNAGILQKISNGTHDAPVNVWRRGPCWHQAASQIREAMEEE